ncbi:MAG: TRAF-like protein [Monoraphidium minutum]|nr:MAG: TRAF-like protein [Monoraphidium minutum]
MEEAAAPPDAGGVLDGVPLERLLGVLRLAHQLDAARLKARLADALARREVGSLPLLVAATNAAADCGLECISTTILGRLHSALPGVRGCTAQAEMRAALGGLNPASLAGLLLLSLGLSPDGGEFKRIVTFPGFSGLAGGGPHYSAPFFAGGIAWRLKLYPEGDGAAAGTHLTLFLQCLSPPERSPVRATFSLAVLGEGGTRGFQHSTFETGGVFEVDDPLWGWYDFASLEELRDARRGYLDGDALRVEVAGITVDEAGGAA